MVTILVVVWIVCGIVSGLIGLRKGEGLAGFLSGVVFGPYGIILTLFSKMTRRRCPECDRLVHKRAPSCPHCGHDFVADA